MNEYLYYFPIYNDEDKNRIKKEVEENFKNKGSKSSYKKLKLFLININKGGRKYILKLIDEEKFKTHKNKKIAHIDDYNNFSLYELRIPPQSRTGVFRVYLTFYPEKFYLNNNVIILEAEFKTEKKAKKIESAYNNLKSLVDDASK
ncbi:hypothetical protein [Marinitoga sp. 1155]|uniref:hypothetical protein n=1 Tax=Marinitoga sp. 1155 TaxID=1428448 RepID=UPI0006411D4D|nr:hypothetical protein [Marinitoga sp. 1155]KLO24775.1 hypothetical protein X274_02120 [Marinitoga sp. 1155]